MNFKKYLLILAKVVLVCAIPAYRFWFDSSGPNLGDLLKEEGYKTIFDSDNPTLDKWKKLYSYHRKDLIGKGIITASTMDEEAAMFANWCDSSLKSYSEDLLNKVRKYCTMNLGLHALEKGGVKLIQNINKQKEAKAWEFTFTKHKEQIINSGIVEDAYSKEGTALGEWCKKNSRKSYFHRNYLIAEHFSTWCVIDEKELKKIKP